MPTPVSASLLNTFDGLAQVVYAGESHESVHQALCEAAVELVPGCDHASLLVRQGNRTYTAAASDDTARRADQVEMRLGEGPCIDAMDDDKPSAHLCGDLEHGCDWPDLAAALRTDLGVHGMAGFRLRHAGSKVGALNIFSDEVGALDEHSLERASLLCSFASVALLAMSRGEEASTLRRGLESNREIGKAVGFLMALHDIDDEAAFSLLSRVSQEMNVKVAEIATRVLDEHAGEKD